MIQTTAESVASKPPPKITNEEKEYYMLIKRAFDVLAPFYDIAAAPISSVRDKVVNFTNATNGSKILDVATGTGKQAFAFVKKGYDVTGIDLSQSMIRVAQVKNKFGNVKFEVADSTNLPFENNTFDVSCVSFALHDMPLTIREKTLEEMVRVTKPKGTIVIVDYALPENKIGRFLIYNVTRLYEAKYYLEFISSDLETLLKGMGMEVKEQIQVMFGAGRILKGIKKNHD